MAKILRYRVENQSKFVCFLGLFCFVFSHVFLRFNYIKVQTNSDETLRLLQDNITWHLEIGSILNNTNSEILFLHNAK